MRFMVWVCLQSVAVLAGSLIAVAPASAEPSADLHLQLVKIMDPTGFEKPLVAATTVLPAGWTTQGGVIWRLNMNECNSGQSVEWTASSPDDKAFIQMLPTSTWEFNNQGMPGRQGCIRAAFRSADEYVSSFIAQMPGGRVTEVERSPEIVQLLSQYPFSTENQGDPYSRTWTDAATVSVEFNRNGERYVGAMVIWTMHNYTLSGHSYGFGPPLEMGYGTAYNMIFMVAPENEIAEFAPAFMLYMKNYRIDPDWNARMMKHNGIISAINIEGAKKRAEITSKSYSDLSDMSMESWRRRDEASDRMQRETSEWIREVETYDADTSSGQIELPSGYDRAFQMDDDTFVVTNDAFFDPWNGRELAVSQ